MTVTLNAHTGKITMMHIKLLAAGRGRCREADDSKSGKESKATQESNAAERLIQKGLCLVKGEKPDRRAHGEPAAEREDSAAAVRDRRIEAKDCGLRKVEDTQKHNHETDGGQSPSEEE